LGVEYTEAVLSRPPRYRGGLWATEADL
jgi:hypothetical protein